MPVDEREALESHGKRKCKILDSSQFQELRELDSTDRKRRISSIVDREVVQIGKLGVNILCTNIHYPTAATSLLNVLLGCDQKNTLLQQLMPLNFPTSGLSVLNVNGSPKKERSRSRKAHKSIENLIFGVVHPVFRDGRNEIQSRKGTFSKQLISQVHHSSSHHQASNPVELPTTQSLVSSTAEINQID